MRVQIKKIVLCLGALYYLSPIPGQSTFPEKDSLQAVQFIKQAAENSEKGNYSKAEQLYGKAIQIYRNNNSWSHAIIYELEASKLSDNFDSPDRKIEHANRALEMSNMHLSDNHVLKASALRQRAEALMWLEKIDSANFFLRQGLPIFRSNQEWGDLAWTNVLLAVNHLNTYALDSSAVYLDSVEILLDNKQIPKDEFDDIQNTLFDLRGVLFEQQGDYDKAIENLSQALNLNLQYQHKSKLDSSFISNQYNSLGITYLTKGDFLRAKDNFLQAIQYDINAQSDPLLLNNIGGQYLKQKQYQNAIKYFERSREESLRILNNSSDPNPSVTKRLTESLNYLCSCYRSLGQYEKALELCQRASEVADGYKAYDTWTITGNIFIEKGNSQMALFHLKNALDDLEQNGLTEKDILLGGSLINRLIGKAYVLNEEPDKALSYFQKSLLLNHRTFRDSLDVLSNPPINGIIEPLYFLETILAKGRTQAKIATDRLEMNNALSTYSLAIEWMDSLKMNFVLDSIQVDWGAEWKSIYEEAINVAYELFEITEDSKYVETALLFSEKSRGSLLLEQLKSKAGRFAAGFSDSIIQHFKTLHKDVVFYDQALSGAMATKDTLKIERYQSYLSEYRLKLAQMEERLEKDYPKYNQLKYSDQHVSLLKIRSEMLTSGTAFIEFFSGDQSVYAFLITKNDAAIFNLGGKDDIQKLVDDFMEKLLDVEDFLRNAEDAILQYNLKANVLFEKLLKVSLDEVSEQIDHLILIPDGNLNGLPFEALTEKTIEESTRDFSSLPFLIYRYKIQYAYTSLLLRENQKRKAMLSSNRKCLAFAPSYHQQKEQSLACTLEMLRDQKDNLTGTLDEIKQLSEYIDGQSYMGRFATKERFMNEADKFGVLHLAMHGVVDIENANLNHLKFSPINSSNEHILYQYEIAGMDLNSQLAVLSACQTGLGTYEKGEGVFSLARTFMYAGVPSIVMSLWRVNDKSTADIMPYFYKNLSKDQNKASSLRNSKLTYLKTAERSRCHPYYWAGFVLIGEGGHLIEEARFPVYFFSGILILVALVGMYFIRKRLVAE
ncbi:MAG: CHAT domain-containing protein [Bacteroidota bacterium]